jgi:hypothetical protein
MNEDALARFRRDNMGVVFQSFHLIPTMTALENVATPLELAGSRDAFARAADELAAMGLGAPDGPLPAQLSGGEQQRVAALARAAVDGRPARRSCSPTSRPATSTARPARPGRRRRSCKLLFDLHDRHGATLVGEGARDPRAGARRPLRPGDPPARRGDSDTVAPGHLAAAEAARMRGRRAAAPRAARAARRARRLQGVPRLPRARGRGDRGGRLGAGRDPGRARARGLGDPRRRRRAHLHLPLRERGRAGLDGGERARGLRDRRLPLDGRPSAIPGETAERALVQVKGVDGLYPLYGTSGWPADASLSEALAERDGLPGSSPRACCSTGSGSASATRCGSAPGTSASPAELEVEPDGAASGFGFGPRVIVERAALEGTGLLTEGTLFDTSYRLRLPGEVTSPRCGPRRRRPCPTPGCAGATGAAARPASTTFVDRMSSFLILMGLAGLAVGGVGVSSAVRAYLEGKTETIAVLKTLGATGRTVFASTSSRSGCSRGSAWHRPRARRRAAAARSRPSSRRACRCRRVRVYPGRSPRRRPTGC